MDNTYRAHARSRTVYSGPYVGVKKRWREMPLVGREQTIPLTNNQDPPDPPQAFGTIPAHIYLAGQISPHGSRYGI